MANKNFFAVNRKLFKNPMWYSEKFTKGQAWVDLFGKANHSPGYFEKNGQVVNLKRGQTGRSIESLADDWKWSRNKVKRFIKRLIDDHMVKHETNHLTSIITICNYDKFQSSIKDSEPPNEPSDEPPNEPSDEPQTIRKKKKKEGINNKIHKPENVSEQTWKDFLTHRKSKKAPVTQTVINTLLKQAGLANMSLEDVMIETIERNWRGFKAEWIGNKSNGEIDPHAEAKRLFGES